LIGTHPHADHIGGIPEVIESFRIGNFFMPARLHTTDSYERVLEAAAKKGLTINTAKRGIQLTLDENLHIQFLSPISDDYDSLNNWSAVLRIEYIDKVFLFTGDAEALLEKEIIESYAPAFLKANFLKVAHHGSNSSTTQQFLDIVDPEIAVMSLGKDNPYGFPHSEVIDRLSKAGIAIYRTDLQGNIVVKSDGNEIWSYQKPLSPNKR
jgi:competence protein ComEC